MSDPRVEVLCCPEGGIALRLSGHWAIAEGIPPTAELEARLEAEADTGGVRFESAGLERWDSVLPIFIARVAAVVEPLGRPLDLSGLPEGARRLFLLARARAAAPPSSGARTRSWLERLGDTTTSVARRAAELLGFVGGVALALVRLFGGRARVRATDVLGETQRAGVEALGILTVIHGLIGAIVAFVSSTTLERFGATLYVADSVTIGVVRELGPLITAVVMAGRTGSAYAAELGTMQVTGEMDALVTMSLAPLEFLVLPRVLALSLMLPLLTVYADLVALVSGGLVATRISPSTPLQYLAQTKLAIPLSTFWVGLAKAAVFGLIVAIAGCAEGVRPLRSAAAVGQAATSAVVQSIVWIIAADGAFAVALYWLKL
jgi:phospholipid/cholesterol/gamma-HCH transport system permease protein